MKQAPTLYEYHYIGHYSGTMACINGRWVAARSIGLFSLRNRLRLAWMVFTGKADALVWPEGQ